MQNYRHLLQKYDLLEECEQVSRELIDEGEKEEEEKKALIAQKKKEIIESIYKVDLYPGYKKNMNYDEKNEEINKLEDDLDDLRTFLDNLRHR